MDKLQYMLAQRIGIFYKNQTWKKSMFDKIAEYYRSLGMIEFLKYTMWDPKIVLKDGTTINFVEANGRSKGRRFTKVIVQPEIDKPIIDTVIKPCILPFANTQCYVVDIYNNKIEYIKDGEK